MELGKRPGVNLCEGLCWGFNASSVLSGHAASVRWVRAPHGLASDAGTAALRKSFGALDRRSCRERRRQVAVPQSLLAAIDAFNEHSSECCPLPQTRRWPASARAQNAGHAPAACFKVR
jgi:hypothetical protein